MKKYVALLRGINVGGRNKLSMTELKRILESNKCVDISTYIQSGNVVFGYKGSGIPSLIKSIQNDIKSEFGFMPDILILDSKKFHSYVEDSPFKSKTGKDLHFYFLESLANKPDLEKLESLKIKSEKFLLKRNTFYLLAPDGIGRSKLAANLEKCLGVSATARNFNTVEKIEGLIND